MQTNINLDYIFGLEKTPFRFDLKIDLADYIKDKVSPQISLPSILDNSAYATQMKNSVIDRSANYFND